MKLKGKLALALLWLILLGGDNAPPPLRLAFLGDIMLGRGVAQAHSDGNWQDMFSPLSRELQHTDFSLANLESPICDGDIGDSIHIHRDRYILNAPERGLVALHEIGVRIVSLANNHSQDCRANGMALTTAALEKMDIKAMTHDGETAYVDTRQGRFAFLAFDDIGRELDIQDAALDVAAAKRKARLVIVSMHWGMEYQGGANERQREQAQALADAGAALIWGHHPHVLQPPAWVRGKGQSRSTLVLYSLGNAMFDQHAPPDAQRSAMVIVSFDAGGAVNMEVYPFIINPRRGRIIAASPTEIDMIYRRMKIDRLQESKKEIWWVKLPTAEK